MPVQDNDEKRTAEQPAVDAEEELRRKQAQTQEHQQDETSTQKSGKLLPFLNAKAEHHQSRIDSLEATPHICNRQPHPYVDEAVKMR